MKKKSTMIKWKRSEIRKNYRKNHKIAISKKNDDLSIKKNTCDDDFEIKFWRPFEWWFSDFFFWKCLLSQYGIKKIIKRQAVIKFATYNNYNNN